MSKARVAARDATCCVVQCHTLHYAIRWNEDTVENGAYPLLLLIVSMIRNIKPKIAKNRVLAREFILLGNIVEKITFPFDILQAAMLYHLAFCNNIYTISSKTH